MGDPHPVSEIEANQWCEGCYACEYCCLGGIASRFECTPWHSWLKPVLGEFIATAAFVFIGLLSVVSVVQQEFVNASAQSNPVTFLIALCFGFAITVLIYIFGDVSGGHINPAVTFGLLVSGNMNFWEAVFYMLAQFLGGIAGAALVVAVITEDHFEQLLINSMNSVQIVTNYTISDASAFCLEALSTGVLMWVVMGAAVEHGVEAAYNAHSKIHSASRLTAAALPIGVTVFLMHIVCIPYTGCGINPARSLAPLIVLLGQDNELSSSPQRDYDAKREEIWIFLIAPLVGAAVSALLYHFLFLTRRIEHIQTAGDLADTMASIGGGSSKKNRNKRSRALDDDSSSAGSSASSAPESADYSASATGSASAGSYSS